MTNFKKILQLNKKGKIVNQYDSIEEASASTGVFKEYIIECCKYAKRSYKGSRWVCTDNEIKSIKRDANTLKNIPVEVIKIKRFSLELLGKFDSLEEASKALNYSTEDLLAGYVNSGNYKPKNNKCNIYVSFYPDITGYHPLSNSLTHKYVFQYDRNGNVVNGFLCAEEASFKLGISVASIISCCEGRTKFTRQGFTFRYRWPEV